MSLLQTQTNLQRTLSLTQTPLFPSISFHILLQTHLFHFIFFVCVRACVCLFSIGIVKLTIGSFSYLFVFSFVCSHSLFQDIRKKYFGSQICNKSKTSVQHCFPIKTHFEGKKSKASKSCSQSTFASMLQLPESFLDLNSMNRQLTIKFTQI